MEYINTINKLSLKGFTNLSQEYKIITLHSLYKYIYNDTAHDYVYEINMDSYMTKRVIEISKKTNYNFCKFYELYLYYIINKKEDNSKEFETLFVFLNSFIYELNQIVI